MILFSTLAYKNTQWQCPACGSPHLQVRNAQPPHSCKLVCADCGRFIKWLPSPRNFENSQNLKQRLEFLKGKVWGWDSNFVNNLIPKNRLAERGGKIFKLSPRQSEQLQRIEENLSSKNISPGG